MGKDGSANHQDNRDNMGICAPSREMIEASKPLKLYLIREDGTRQELNTWSAEPVAQILKRQLALPKHLHSGVKILFCDNVVPHSQRIEEAGIENEAEVKVIGLNEALEAKAREEEERRRKQEEKEAKEAEKRAKKQAEKEAKEAERSVRRALEEARSRSVRSYRDMGYYDSCSSGRTRSYGSSASLPVQVVAVGAAQGVASGSGLWSY